MPKTYTTLDSESVLREETSFLYEYLRTIDGTGPNKKKLICPATALVIFKTLIGFNGMYGSENPSEKKKFLKHDAMKVPIDFHLSQFEKMQLKKISPSRIVSLPYLMSSIHSLRLAKDLYNFYEISGWRKYPIVVGMIIMKFARKKRGGHPTTTGY
jgi:hypothetical protein